jgi:hypothetical protein
MLERKINQNKQKKTLPLQRIIASFLLLPLLSISAYIYSQYAHAAITKEISYQGKLTNTSGVAVADGNYNMVLSLYTVSTGGTPVWTARGTVGTPTTRSVAVANGIFSIMLGDTAAGDNAINLDFNSTYYLGIKVGSDTEMAPRKKVGASGYAFNSDLLDGLDSATSGANAHIVATDASGNITATGDANVNGGDINSTTTLTLNPTGNLNFQSSSYYVNESGQMVLNTDETVNGIDINTGAISDVTTISSTYLNTAASYVDIIGSAELRMGGTSVLTSARALQNITAATIDNIYLNGTTIGHTSDTDLLNLANGILTVNGTLDLNGPIDLDVSVNDYAANFYNSNTGAAAGGLYIRTDGTGNLLTLNASGTDIVTISPTQASFNVPTSFTSSGDVSMAYDLIFTNQTAANIKTNAPFTIEVGELFESNDLTLRTFNNGDVVLDAAGGVTLMQAQPWVLATATSALNFQNSAGTSILNIDSTNGRVGVGTTGPSNKLTILPPDNGGITVREYDDGNDAVKLSAGGTSGWLSLYNSGTESIRLHGFAGTASYINNGGNFGIGTTNPTEALDVNGRVRLAQTTAPVTTTDKMYNVSGNLYWNGVNLTGGGSLPSGTSGQTLRNNGSGWVANSVLYNDGTNIGIGTTSPGAKLEIADSKTHVSGDLAGTDALLRLYNNYASDVAEKGAVITFEDNYLVTNRTTRAAIKGGTATSGNTANGFLAFYTDASGANSMQERMRINYNGNVGIGTNNPSYPLHVNGGDIYTSGDMRIAGDDLFMATNTSGMLLIADGTNYNPVAMSGDVTITSAGVTTIADNSVDGTDIALGSDTTGDLMYYNGTDWARLADIATGNALISGGVGVAPSWGKIVLGTHTTGSYVATEADTLATVTARGTVTNGQSITIGPSASYDPINISAVAMGSASYVGIITSTDLTASRTWTFPNVAGTVITTGDTGTVTNTMLAGSIANTKLANSTISGIALGGNLAALTIGTGLSGTSYNGSTAVTIAVNTSQNISTLSNLTTNGFVKTSGGTGALSIDTNTYLTANQSISLTGDVTGTGTTSIATTIAANSVALTTDTTGNYVANVATGSGLTGGSAGSEGAALTLSLSALAANWSQTGAFDIVLGNASSELQIMESTGATYYGTLDVGDLSANGTYTFSGASGTVYTTANSPYDTEAEIDSAVSNNGYLTSFSEADTLATVTGRGATTATGLTLTGGATIRGITVDNATATDDRIAVAITTGGAARFDGTITNADLTAARTWTFPNVAGTVITTGDTGTVTNTMLAGSIANTKLANSTISGIALGGNLAALTIGTGLSGTSYNGSTAVTIAVNTSQNISTLSNLTTNGFVKTSGGTGALSIDTNTYLTANQSISLTGDVTGTGTTSIATTIAANSVALTTDTTGNYVANVATGSGLTGGSAGSEGAALTLSLSALAANWSQTGAFDIVLGNASSELQIMESTGATYYGTLDVGDLSANGTYTFSGASGTVWTSGNDGASSTLDADLLDGAQPSMVAGNSTIVQRNASGYVFANYFNTTANVTATAASHFAVQNSTDGYIRWQTPADARTSLGLVASGAGDIWVEKAGDTMTGQLASTLATGTSPFAVTSTTVNTNLNADLFDNYHGSSYLFASAYNYANGYLIATDISATSDSMFEMDITGNSYGSVQPIHITVQGYNYNTGNAIINTSALAEDWTRNIAVFNYNGYLYFWLDQDSAYQSIAAFVRTTMDTALRNRVTGITNVVKPTTGVTREVSIVPRQGWNNGNDGTGSTLDADLWDGNQFASYLNQAVLTTSSPTFSRVYTTGLSTSWGSTSGVNTGGMNVTMGTSTAATWLLSGTSSGTFRAGIQSLDSDGQLRIYSGSSYIGINGNTISMAGQLTNTVATGTAPFVISSTTLVSNLNADLLDGISSGSFLRSDADDNLTAAIVVPTANRDEGIFGTYDSTKTQHIWSMGTGYRNAADGTTFGNLYGLAYKYNGNAGGHGVYLVQNGVATAGLGTNIWTTGTVTGSNLSGTNTGDQTISLSGAVSGSGTGAISTSLNNNASYPVAAGVGNGLKFWSNSDEYKIAMGSGTEYNYGPVTDYSIKSFMNDAVGRGWTWGNNGVAPIAALSSANGNMQIAGSMTIAGLSAAGIVTNTAAGLLGTTATLGAAYITDDSLDFADFEDTMDLDAALTLNQAANVWTQGFTGTTTTGFTYNANSLTSGTGMLLSSSSISSGNLLNVRYSNSADTVAFTGNLGYFNLTSTWTGASSPTNSGNMLEAARNITMNSATYTNTVSGAVLRVSDAATLTAGAFTHTANTLEIVQSYTANTGAAVNITTAGTGLALRVNDDGTLTDTTPFIIDASGNVGIGTTSTTSKLYVNGTTTLVGDLNVTESAAATVNFSGTKPTSVATTPATSAAEIFDVAAPAGGDTTIATTGVGGVGSGMSWTMGVGGVAASALTQSTGGVGGTISFAAGAGGAAAATGIDIGGAGGNATLAGGAGGAATVGTSLTGGAGGYAGIFGGAAGAGGNANGGSVYVRPGARTGTGTSSVYIGDANATGIAFGNATTNPTFTFSGSGLVTVTGGLTLAGTLTANGTFDANGAVTLGDNGDNVTIDSSVWNITAAGAISGITTLSMSGQLTSTLATGTSPFAVTSTTLVDNLNADFLDGAEPSMVAGNSTIVQRNASGYVFANYFNTTANVTTSNATHFAIQTGSDNYIRWQTPADARGSLGLEAAGAGDIWVEKAGDTMTGSLTLNPASANTISIEQGYTGGTATTPFIDFHSGATSVDFDSRIIASGGTGTTGQGILTVNASSFAVGGNITTTGTVDGYDISAYGPYFISSAGTSGQVWTSDGSGAGAWAAAASGMPSGASGNTLRHNGTSWIADSALYNNGTNIGIGTTTPSAKLDIFGTTNGLRLSYSAAVYSQMTTLSTGELQLTGSYSADSAMVVGAGTATDQLVLFDGNTRDFYVGQDDTDDFFKIGSGAAVGSNTYLTINGSGNVGIGVTSPATYKFYVDWNSDGASPAYVSNTNAWSAGGADYAEFFKTNDPDLSPGEAVCVDTQNSNAVKRCTRAEDPDLMGIVSTTPAVLGNAQPEREFDNSYVIVGMLGQVPAKVSTENGQINPGDSLTAATKPGTLMKANAGDSTVGVALEPIQQGEGSIQVLISRRNKSLTVEKVEEEVSQRIAQMDVEDQVNQIITQAQTQLNESINSQTTVITDLTGQLTQTSNKIATLQEQMDLIKQQNQTILDFALALDIEKLIYKDESGNLDLKTGKLITAEVVAGAFTVKVTDENNKTIGESKIKAITKDEDNDGRDDETGSDGKSVVVKTGAVGEGSKIYVTPVGSTKNQVLYVDDIKEGESFVIRVDNVVDQDVECNWWIVKSE